MSEFIVADDYIHDDETGKPVIRYQKIVGEIVRCRDCKNYHIVDETYDCDPIYGCSYFSLRNARIDDDVREPQDPDGFCAWGERTDKLPGVV